ncbi:acetyl-CoA carboxylase, biotin carboxyl carrier protein [Aliidongia dinghuensis]|uniref:Biotin carboxyl carrier protein of acetyl-CoA carboxylase n=1 Tax=Aliidongia dinghuensis TaxID=1867774 RepID=A0A8J2YY71_9PROT|nr:acetyl-CoA carboxylase biotin carboxyl carrier protein [Aliidongia dinghuensis]GGF31639.1 acetyl-CoA carboxylase, biotin carboxyl carrier protein [Aliidongia dinghuensis]
MTKPNDFTVDEERVRKLATLLDEAKLTEIEYAWGEHRIRVTRSPAPIASYAAPIAAPAAAAQPLPAEAHAATHPDAEFANHPGAVKSPMVGTAYLSPQPGAPPFVRVGDTVSAGQPLLIIEAMKVMNQIRAPKAGKVGRLLVTDGNPVEFGQVVLVLE